MASVRYMVHDVDEAVSFYRDLLGFTVEMHNPSKFAALSRGDLSLLINAPGAGSAGKAGGDPQPGGWSRFGARSRVAEREAVTMRVIFGASPRFCQSESPPMSPRVSPQGAARRRKGRSLM